MKKVIILSCFSILSLTASAYTFNDIVQCKSFSGKWSRASIEWLDDGTKKITVKMWGKNPISYLGKFVYESALEDNYDSPYGEVYESFESNDLPQDLQIDYTFTSDGPDYMYLKSDESETFSSLSCR